MSKLVKQIKEIKEYIKAKLFFGEYSIEAEYNSSGWIEGSIFVESYPIKITITKDADIILFLSDLMPDIENDIKDSIKNNIVSHCDEKVNQNIKDVLSFMKEKNVTIDDLNGSTK